MPERTYAFWLHNKSGCLYAIRQEDGVVTGCCGPVNFIHADRSRLEDYHYEDTLEDAFWVQDNEAGFSLYEGELPHA